VDHVGERTGTRTAAEPRPESATATLGMLFTDIAGSTRLWEEQPAAMTAALARHDAILRDAIETADGRIVKTTGDGMMAVFVQPSQAVAASLAAQRALAAEPWGATGALRVRMGLHAGEAQRRGDDFFGPTINRTARIMAAGHGGQVLLSAAASALAADRLPDGASLRDLGEYQLRDIGRPERVFQLVHPALEASFPPLQTLDLATASLPVEAGTFIGRAAERSAIADALTDGTVRLLTLTGPGGTGKTSLAVRVATDLTGRFRDGIAFVDVSTVQDTHGVLLALGRVLGVAEVPDPSLQQQLIERLWDRKMLLVLDNFEQVTEAASLVAGLVADCPGLKVLVTSREPLHIRAERTFAVPPLDLPPATRGRVDAGSLAPYGAVQLFVDRARAVRPDFELTDENADAVADICRRLDGLPLAIELAAGRLRLFSPETLRDRLTSRLELLRSSARDLPARHQTLRATIEWSYQLLEADEQRVFELLAAFADADLPGVEAVASGGPGSGAADVDVVDAIASLLEKNLVRQVEGAGAEPRFSMLETIREFATERLDVRTDAADVRRAHATHFTEMATHLRGQLIGFEHDRAMTELVTEAGNLRIALRFWVAEGDLAQLARLTDCLLVLNEARGWYHDTVELTTTLLSVLATTPQTPELAERELGLRMSLARGIVATEGFTPEAERTYTTALERFEGQPQHRVHYSILRALANLYMLKMEFDRSGQLGEQILAIAEADDDDAMRIDGHLVVGATMVFTDGLQTGLDHLDTALALYRAHPSAPRVNKLSNDPRVASLTTSAFVLWLLGKPDSAVTRADEAIALAHRLDHPYTSAYALFHSGLLHLWRREPDLVLDRAIRLLDVADAYDLRIWSAIGSCLQGAAQARLGQADQGLTALRDGMTQYQGLVSPPVFWPMLLFVVAGSAGAAGRPAEGLEPIELALGMLGPNPTFALAPELQLVHGDLLAALGRPDAREVYVGTLATARRIGVPMAELQALTRLVRTATGEDRTAFVTELRTALDALDEGFETADLRDAWAALVEAERQTR
jgi:predicted ATPase/class 3 adenylate cyclase